MVLPLKRWKKKWKKKKKINMNRSKAVLAEKMFRSKEWPAIRVGVAPTA